MKKNDGVMKGREEKRLEYGEFTRKMVEFC
jgi:hypothetical protein